MRDTIDNGQDVIDSRDIIERIKELEEFGDFSEGTSADDKTELAKLKALEAEAEPYCPDWCHGAQLIRDSYFEEYAQELAENIGAIDPKASWPNDCIDWERAARKLQHDYTSIDFDGVTYWVR